MTSIEILGFSPSTFVRTARMTAIEKGVEHILKPLAFKTPEHFALHPFGKMPVLRHGSVVLAETVAIASYIDRAFAGPALMPKDPLPLARMWQTASVAAMEAYATLVTAALGDAGVSGIDVDAANRLYGWLEDGAYLCRKGDHGEVTLADLLWAPIVAFHQLVGGEMRLAPRTQDWWQMISSRESFLKTVSQ